MLRKRKPLFWSVMLLVILLLSAGCNKSTSPDSTTSVAIGAEQQSSLSPQSKSNQTADDPKASEKMDQSMMQMKIYYATQDALYLAPEIHAVPQNIHPAKTALELLTAAPINPDLVSVIPPGTKVLGVNIRNHIAYADFNDALIKNNPGGSTNETLLVGAIVNTLTEFPEIQKVQILVNGKEVDTITGHMDTSEPLSRTEKFLRK